MLTHIFFRICNYVLLQNNDFFDNSLSKMFFALSSPPPRPSPVSAVVAEATMAKSAKGEGDYFNAFNILIPSSLAASGS